MKKLILFLLVLSLGIHVNYAQVPQSEKDALIALYNNTNGATWTTNDNWLDSSEPVSTWYGVVVTNNHVTALYLGSNNLTGSLPSEIGDFPELTMLYFWGNNITGPIPPQIGNLSNLVEIDFAPNGFSGSIPTEIGNLTNLEVLWLNNCGLSGNIPHNFENLVNLRELYLMGGIFGNFPDNPAWANSEYSGDFPDLTALPLEVLRIQNNFFTYDNIDDNLVTYMNTIPDFQYSPQLTENQEETITFNPGDDIALSIIDTPVPSLVNRSTSASNTYQWFKDNVEITGATSLTYLITNLQATDEGVYTGRVSNADAPDFEYTTPPFTLEINLGTDSKELDGISIYPNPVKNELHFDFKHVPEPLIVSLYDMRGKQITARKLNSDEALDLSFLSGGIYAVKIKTNRFVLTKKIIKR